MDDVPLMAILNKFNLFRRVPLILLPANKRNQPPLNIMSPNNMSINNRRIAKNTILLYLRMLVTMVVTLYTSRVVLNTLGIEDYGIYSVVAGVVVLFSFINNAMSTGTQRHLSYELGKADGRVSDIFSACLRIHVVLGVLIVVLGEAFGLWFLNSGLNIPAERLYAANVIFHISLITCFVGIVKTPYDASVIAYEKMSFYAYMSIFDVVAKLLMVYVLMVIPYDKLILYCVFILFVSITGVVILVYYVHRRLAGIEIVDVKDRNLYKYLLSFSGWTLFGSTAGMLESQGLNMIINIFFGVVLNAAVGIANQIRGVLNQFVGSFQQALNPQLVMAESSGDRLRQNDLIFRSAKFSFFILFALSLPVMANLQQILSLWLGQVPAYAVPICILVIVSQLLECLSSPLYTTIFAIGKIKVYQWIVSLLRLLGVLSALAICSLNIEPYMIYLMPCVVACLLLFYRIWFIYTEIGLSIRLFLKRVVMPILAVCCLTVVPVLIYKQCVPADGSIVRLLLETFFIAVFTVSPILFVGITSSERAVIFHQFRKIIKR